MKPSPSRMKCQLPSDRPLRFLITRTDRIGDLVLSTPVFAAVRRQWPDAWIAALTFTENRQILEGNPHLDEVILYDKTGAERSWLGNGIFARMLAAKKFDAVIHLHATNRMHLVTWLAGIPVRVGWDRRLPWALTHVLPYVKKEGKKHEAAYNFDLLQFFDIAMPAKLETFFPVTERWTLSLEELLQQMGVPNDKPWIVLSPGASDPAKVWAAEGFAGVAEALARRYDAVFLAIGARQDRSFVQALCRRAQVPIFDLSGRLSLGMLGALFQRSVLLISNDSGPVHVAQAVGTPVLSVFVRTQPGLNPERWKPIGANGAFVVQSSGGNTSDDASVLNAASDLLASRLKEPVKR